jgi:pimeloyl-ACP methyl ester carboxylesterase
LLAPGFRVRAAAVALIATLAVGTVLPPAPAAAQTPLQPTGTPGPCVLGTLPGGAKSMICIPSAGWNGDLVVWAHGYVDVTQPLDFAHLVLPDGTSIPLLAQGLGFAFATTSYRSNGLTVLGGVHDVLELIFAVPAVAGRPPGKTFLIGASEGGLISTLVAERAPAAVSGVLATCGPIGDFGAQINYIGDFRVLFDAYFPGVLPGSPIQIPQQVIDNWNATYLPAVTAALASNPALTAELLRVAGVPHDPADPVNTMIAGATQLLWYSVFGTNDARAKLGGNPYDNQSRQYTGSSNDPYLNAVVQRFRADAAAVAAVEAHRTTGSPGVPLVALHTTLDPLVPVTHMLYYVAKAQAAGNPRVTPGAVERWGHCNFTAAEAMIGLLWLVLQASAAPERAPASPRPAPFARPPGGRLDQRKHSGVGMARIR